MADTVAQLSSDSKIAISLKKLQGKAHTKNTNELYNEGLPTGITMDSSTVFGQTPPANPQTNLYQITDDIVEKVRLKVEFIAGSDSSSGRHGFKLSLMDDYESNSSNPNKGTAPFVNGQDLVSSLGQLQLVPPSFNYLYEAIPYWGDLNSLNSIPLADPRDWNLDYFNGVFFQQDPPGTGDHAQNPTYIDAYIYIGDMLKSLVEAAGQTGGSDDIAPKNATYITITNDNTLTDERTLGSSEGITLTDFGAGNSMSIGIDNSVIATISGSAFTGDISAPNINTPGTLNANRLEGANIFLDDGQTPAIVGGANVSITVDQTTGQRIIDTLGGDSQFIQTSPGHINTSNEVAFKGDLAEGFETTDVGLDVTFFVSGSVDTNGGKSVFGGDVVVSGSIKSEGGVNVGPIDNTGGFINTFTENTLVGEALAQVNQMLAKLAPTPAPLLDSISEEFANGVSARLSFGPSIPKLNYRNHTSAAGFSAPLDANDLFQDSAEEGGNIRVGVFGTSVVQIGGACGANTPSYIYDNGVVNYPARAIGKGDQGSIRIEHNGTTLYTLDLTDPSVGAGSPGAGTGVHTNTKGSGFVSVSSAGFGKFQNTVELEYNVHRTLDWRIGREDFEVGHNWLRVSHVIGQTTNSTNYVEWIYDDSTDLITVSNNILESQTYSDEVRVSGIKYFSTGSILYSCNVSNLYSNTFPAESNAISFNVTDAYVESIEIDGQSTNAVSVGVPFMDAATDEQDKELSVKASVRLTPPNWLLNTGTGVGINVTHPLKVDVSNAGFVNTSGILMYQDVSQCNETYEDFFSETYRINPGAYDTQGDIAGEDWNSLNDLSAGGHMIVSGGKLLSPLMGINGGNYKNQTDGGIIANGPENNVDYSGITGEIVYYRKIQNDTGSTMFNIKLEIEGDGELVSAQTPLASNFFRMFIKLPQGTLTEGSTGWCDLTKDFHTGEYDDGDGLLKQKLQPILPSENLYTFGVNGVGIGDHVIIKVIADSSWTGHLSSINVEWDTKRYVVKY